MHGMVWIGKYQKSLKYSSDIRQNENEEAPTKGDR